VGCVENGILCAAWSPDLDILALYTGTLLLYDVVSMHATLKVDILLKLLY